MVIVLLEMPSDVTDARILASLLSNQERRSGSEQVMRVLSKILDGLHRSANFDYGAWLAGKLFTECTSLVTYYLCFL